MESSKYPEDVKTLQDKLLCTIEEGDAVDILAEEYSESLNELMKAELIEIRNDKLELTDKGRQAKIIGVKDCLVKNPGESEKIRLEDFSENLSRDSRNRSLLIVLFFLMLSLVVIMIFLNF